MPCNSYFAGATRHLRVVSNDVLKRVGVEISVHVDAIGSEDLVVLRARQRCQYEQLNRVYWQLLLNDLDVVRNGLRRVISSVASWQPAGLQD